MEQSQFLTQMNHYRTLLQVKPCSSDLLGLLSLLDSQLPPLLHHNAQVQEQLVSAKAEIKQLSKKMRKNNSKLARKEEQCSQLKDELERTLSLHAIKVQQLTKNQHYAEGQSNPEDRKQSKVKKKATTPISIQCQILDPKSISDLQRQNAMLKNKLQGTQKMLKEEKQLNRDLTLRLEVLNVLKSSPGNDEVKDNSTIETDSLSGDPFEECENLMGVGSDFERREPFGGQESPLKAKNWLNSWWHSGWHLYKSWTKQS